MQQKLQLKQGKEKAQKNSQWFSPLTLKVHLAEDETSSKVEKTSNFLLIVVGFSSEKLQ